MKPLPSSHNVRGCLSLWAYIGLSMNLSGRPQIFPNYGFVKQLHVFAACNYAPAPSHPAYRSWKRRQKQDVTQFLNLCHDTTSIVPGVYLNRYASAFSIRTLHNVNIPHSELPDDPDQLRCLARYTGLSHILTLRSRFTSCKSEVSEPVRVPAATDAFENIRGKISCHTYDARASFPSSTLAITI